MSVENIENIKEHRFQLFDKEKLYSVRQVAERLGLSAVTVRHWIYSGRITAHRVLAPGAKLGRLRISGTELMSILPVAYERDV